MAIKNYSTSIAADKTILEIQAILARKGASKIMIEYDAQGQPKAVVFMLRLSDSEMPYMLPNRPEPVLKILQGQKQKGLVPKLAHRDINLEQARRIGWRILKDWMDAQMALVEIGMADMQEVFMPYLFSPSTGKTLYEISKGKQFQNLLPAVT